ncbi:polysaccharide biosynthesis protein [Pelagibacteraceae bacterium]|nr:polysaccharide biosynthesis protein [Pelagibacteraceae bacterium]
MNIILTINNNATIKKLLLVFIDSLLLIFSFWLAFVLRTGELYWIPNKEYNLEYTIVIISIFIIFYSLALFFNLYNIVIRYIDINTVYLISKILICFSAIWGSIILYLSIPGFPRSVIIMYPTIIVILFYLSRLILQSIAINVLFYNDFSKKDVRKKNVIIYGAGSSGAQLAQALIQSKKNIVINFIDDDKKKLGRNIFGINIISFNEMINKVKSVSIDEIHLALPKINKSERTKILTKLSLLNIRIRTLPPLSELLKGNSKNIDVLNLDIEELLERNTANLSNNIYEKILSDKNVMVTGAGGSIGSELCRQILDKKPKTLILFDVSEFAIYKIQEEIEQSKDDLKNTKIVYLIGSVQNTKSLDSIINKWKPNIIYHTAAYKHVPIVENNIVEGFKNNVSGTLNIALSSIKHKVENFVLISTDKAVRPTNVMGYTKRFAELVLQGIMNENFIEVKDNNGLNIKYKQETNFSIVRFGNVFESSGSVIPLFRRQLEKGGPITITHKDVTRYFMTTKEAAQLVILSGSFEKQSNPASIYLLDMGRPVKIIDLAKKMIIQNGLTIRDESNRNGDIEIKIIGLRPGEKIFEELLISGKPEKTHYEKIYKSYEPFKNWLNIYQSIQHLEETLNEDTNFKLLLKNIID